MAMRPTGGWKVIVTAMVVVLFPAATTWAETATLDSKTLSSNVRVVTHHARVEDVAALKRRYELETGAVVVPVLVSASSEKTMSSELSSSYAERELSASHLQQFAGGDVVIAVSITAILVVALVILLIVLLT